MEGISGVVHGDQVSSGGAGYGVARKWMAEDVNAAIEGALAAGADEIVVNDSHTRGDAKLVETVRASLFSCKYPVAETVIMHRVPYINAITTGKTGPEKNKQCAGEIDSLWGEIEQLLATSKKEAAE